MALVLLKVPFLVPRRHWRELALLTLVNMLVWHVVVIIALQQLSSGRSAILGYTMPVFAALIGALGVRRPPAAGRPGPAWPRPAPACCCCCGASWRPLAARPAR
jgi:drug/metabolite transporter (DMT)-like permease